MRGDSVIVTGASRGIGRAISAAFAREGARVVMVSRDEAALQDAATTIRDRGHDAVAFPADVTSLDGMEAMAEAAAHRHGGIDIVCANAGIYPQGTIGDLTTSSWDEVQAVNLRGTFHCVKACLPHLKRTKAGRIVITSSITGPITAMAGWSHYGAAKAGQLGFMRGAALELARFGVTVNAVLPGTIAPGIEDIGSERMKGLAAGIPVGRLGTPEDVAEAVRFLASPAAGFITGQTIVVDGGQSIVESRMPME